MTNTELAPTPFNAIEYGPLLEQTRITSGLDYYKPTMSQLAHEVEPTAEVTFTFHNRGQERLLDYIDMDNLKQRFDAIRTKGWEQDELDYLASIRSSKDKQVFGHGFLDYLKDNELPEVEVSYDEEIDDIAIEATGPWALSTFWETIVMGELNEAYFEGVIRAEGKDPFEVYEEGDKRLSEKIAILQANPQIKFADFGNRRHFSLRWQKHVVERLLSECPENFIGTSNVGLANSLGVKPIGTFAHEMPMVYAGLADIRGEDIRASHNHMLGDWFDRYDEDLSIALTDTFTTDFFFSDFTPEQAALWHGTRQDSGDPYKYANTLIEFYENLGIDSRQKTVVFSDGLNIDDIVNLDKAFNGRINVLFGWGTTLTNDLGMKALNIVMKATHVRLLEEYMQAYTVKLSDDDGKNTGPKKLVKKYRRVFGKEKVAA